MRSLIDRLLGRRYYKHVYTGDYTICVCYTIGPEPDPMTHAYNMTAVIPDYKDPKANQFYAPLKPMYRYNVEEVTREEYLREH